MNRVTRLLTGTGTVLLLAALLGCGGEQPAALSDEVRVEIQQGRTDYSSGAIVIRVVNESENDVALRQVTLVTPAFPESPAWDRGTTVRAGTTVDLRTPLPEPDCSESTDAPRVSLEFRSREGAGTVQLLASDPLGTLLRLHDESCVAEEVERLATITVGAPQVTGTGATSVATLPITFAPTGADGTLSVTGVSSTPLLKPAPPATGAAAKDWTFALTLTSSGDAVTEHLEILPARCDPHAIAEDKVGTVLSLSVDTGSRTGSYRLVPPTDVTDALLAFVHDACGMP